MMVIGNILFKLIDGLLFYIKDVVDIENGKGFRIGVVI